MNYKCYLFDFDGTIADTLDEAFRIYNEITPLYNLREVAKDELPFLKTLSVTKLCSHLGIRKRHIPGILTAGKKKLGKKVEQLQPIQGIRETLIELRSCTPLMGILTSNSRENVENFLSAHQLEVFDFISTIPKLKGKSKNLKSILRTFGLSHNELIYIGDEVRDVRAAQHAGVAIAAVTWGFNAQSALAEFAPQYLFNKAEELLELTKGALRLPERPRGLIARFKRLRNTKNKE